MYYKKQKKRLLPVAVSLLLVIVIAGFVLLLYRNGHPVVTSTASGVSSSHTGKDSVTKAGKVSVSSSTVASLEPIQVSLQNAAKPLWIHVNIAKQIVTVYDAENRVVESYLCSTGSPGYDTPKGTFHVYNRGKSFFSKKYQEGAYDWVAFYEDYYFHSVPYDKDKQIIQSVASDLGRQDSHGCVHLSIENSKWIYDNIPNKTKVVIE